MRIDIVEAKTKNSKTKIIVVLLIVVIILSAIFGVKYSKTYKQNCISNMKVLVEESSITNKGELTHSKLEEIESENKTLLPIYSENAKQKMSSIYNDNSKIAYLTFDDGPSQAVTPLILDLLKKENIKATFFVLGTNVKANPEILKRAYIEGHYIANHGYSHNYSKIYKNAESVLEEYNKTEKLIQQTIENREYSSYLFRFPGGFEGGKYAKIKKQAGKLLNKNNIFYLDWNVLTGDAQGANTKEKILKNIKKYTANKRNIVVLMHDSSSKILTYESLRQVIEFLRGEGYTFSNFYDIMK